MLPYSKKTKNCLLTRDDVGKGKPTTRVLPPGGFSYGKTQTRDLEGVGQVISCWKPHASSKSQKPDRDFKKLNKIGVKSGALTAKETALFRKQADARMPEPKAKCNVQINLPDDEFTYGKPLKPSTPIQGVICNGYGEAAECEKLFQYEQIYSQKLPSKPTDIRPTKASQVRQRVIKAQIKQTTEDAPSLFKMKKFQKVEKRTDTKSKAMKVTEKVKSPAEQQPQKIEASSPVAEGESP